MPKPSDYVDQFRELLTRLGAEPVGIGAFAALRYRLEPRETTDLDFLVRSLDGVVGAAEDLGLHCRVMSHPGGEPYVIFIRGDGIAVDVLMSETDYQDEAIRRAVDGWLTVEDVIIHKLIAWRAKDQDDIESILATRPALDERYIERWVGEWQVESRWAEATRRWMTR
ncbi:MAG: hypothetical protein M3P52_01505 [Actinomycetota bacterium]|nr:hypothetical protein [Actinomycetota bacterium]